MPQQNAHRHNPSRSAQQGVVLVVVLIMLVVIALMSAAVMRGALTSDTLTNNNRTQTLAYEAAQTALRLCEQDSTKISNSNSPVLFVNGKTVLPTALDTVQMAWRNAASWAAAGPAITIPLDMLTSANTQFTLGQLPQCLAEYDHNADPTSPLTRVIVLTARGFSPDYHENATGNVISGSVVWLQSRYLLK